VSPSDGFDKDVEKGKKGKREKGKKGKRENNNKRLKGA